MSGARLRALVQGRVQGVGYRWFAQTRGGALGLAGGVRNLANGSVEVICEGPRERLEQFLVTLRAGPFGADVREVDAKWEAGSGEYKSFEIWPSS